MRIREIYFHNVRSFRGEHRISFIDPLTDEVCPVTVIAGTNGTGKTTIFDVIEALLRFAIDPSVVQDMILAEIAETGFVRMSLELEPSPLAQAGILNDPKPVLNLICGRKDLAPENLESVWPNALYYIPNYPYDWHSTSAYIIQRDLAEMVRLIRQGHMSLRSGLIYFPQSRQLIPQSADPGSIQSPPVNRDVISRMAQSNQWKGSLEELWVWQNYLDLEASARGQVASHLQPFHEVENDLTSITT